MTPLGFIRPCSPTSASKPPAGAGWIYEPKVDGSRLQITKEGGQVRLYSRGGHEWTKRPASLAEAVTAIPHRSLVIDAELCCAGN
jgi:bifunctional non-homologous end joining protein LigD